MKKLISFCVSLLLLATTVLGQAKIPAKPYPEKLVNDYAGILTQNEESRLETKLREIDNRTSIQICVVIITSLDGADAYDFSAELGDSWGIGHINDKLKNNAGVVVLVSLDRNWAIRSGAGIAREINKTTADIIGEKNLIPHLSDKSYYMGFVEVADRIVDAAGDMPWEQRLDKRKIDDEKAVIEQQKQAERERVMREAQAERDAIRQAEEDRKSKEFWGSFWSIAKIVIVILLLGVAGYGYYIYTKRQQAEKDRRKQLKDLCSNSFIDAHGTIKNISSICKAFPELSLKQPQWVYREIESNLANANELHEKLTEALDYLRPFQDGPVEEKEKYNQQYKILSDTPALLMKIQKYVSTGIAEEVAQEEKNKKAALEAYQEETASCDASCKKIAEQGYNLDQYQHMVDALIKKFGECVSDEEKLGKDFDNKVQEIVAGIKEVETTIVGLPGLRASVDKRLSEVNDWFARFNDYEVKKAITLLNSKYQQDAVASTISKWNTTIMLKFEQMKAKTTSVKELNSMEKQQFTEAEQLVKDIEDYIEKSDNQRRLVLDLDAKLAAAKSEVLSTRSSIEALISTVRTLMVDSDVYGSTESTANTLLTQIQSFVNATSAFSQPDWISYKTIATKLEEDVESIISTMRSEIRSAETARENARLEKIRQQNEAAQRRTYSSGSGSGWGGFGGGGGFKSGGSGSGGKW